MTAPPEVLQWARAALNGLTSLEYKARFEGLEVSSEVWKPLMKIERELVEFLEAHKTADPTKWVSASDRQTVHPE